MSSGTTETKILFLKGNFGFFEHKFLRSKDMTDGIF